MNHHAQLENAKTLAQILGLSEEEASGRLEIAVALTVADDAQSRRLGTHLERLLSRTIRRIFTTDLTLPAIDAVVEVVIGSTQRRLDVACWYVGFGDECVIIDKHLVATSSGAKVHGIGLLLGACYACGAALKAALGDALPFPAANRHEVDLRQLVGDDLPRLHGALDFGEAVMAGAGAIGNAFVYGLCEFAVRGRLHVVDDDKVSGGNLQRCVYFGEADINHPKAECLAAAARQVLPAVQVEFHNCRLQDLPFRKPGPWLHRLIVGVDSPRARRELQSEIPGEVFDASTTGVSEVVFHFHRQPTIGACLACVYHESPQEEAHERHVAETLGVALSDVKESRISPAAAARICVRYPQLRPEAVTGLAYDTLFKQLCSTRELVSPEGRQVLAPFAFVSALAGAMLALEFVRRTSTRHGDLFNAWRISPWSTYNLRLRRVLGRKARCEFCGNEILSDLAASMWDHQKNVGRASCSEAITVA